MAGIMGIIKQINEKDIPAPYYIDDEIDMEGAEQIAVLDRDEHRWYVVGTVVFKLGDEFFGVRGPISVKSEAMGFDDIGMQCEAFEMVEVPSVKYVRK